MSNYDVIILGGGPAGLAAGIYLSRGKQSVLILDQGMVGGQVILTHAVANYPGLPELSGYKLASEMKKQAEEFGCEIKGNEKLISFNFQGKEKIVTTKSGEFSSKAVIIAVGGQPRKLGLESEAKFQGLGISYCATCDGDFFTGEDIVVVGGGNSALEEAVSLTKFAKTVTIIHQFDHFQAYTHAIKDAEYNSKISFIMESDIVEFTGEQSLTGVNIRHKKDGAITKLNAAGAFIFIGYVPSSELFKECVSLSDRQEILTDQDMATDVPGVFAAGDVRQKKFRQITTAVSDGTIAALAVMDYLNDPDPDKI
ncbi:MAG: FAD-dependent oxidoreductase [Spirochaetia bacterium]|jgi:thioredoxin reductase (NADPH)|nr:FAD-dependent oxidoreductase [Spirochaetia bacterium]